jgi:hypothetical protein
MFEAVIAECQDLEPLAIRQLFKFEGMCRICQLKVRTTKHLVSFSHRRKEICIQLFVLKREIKAQPSAACLVKIRDLLQTKTTEDCYLLSIHPANWPVMSNTGCGVQRGKQKDASKVWFMEYVSDLETICLACRGTELSVIAEEIQETMTDLRLKKLERVDPAMKVELSRPPALKFIDVHDIRALH